MLDASVSTAGAARVALLLGCSDTLAAGSTIPGFHVEATTAPRELALLGRGRFSAYALNFRIDQLGGAETDLRAETRAEFPGVRGRLYRWLVIGTGVHVLVTRRLLDGAKRRAERV